MTYTRRTIVSTLRNLFTRAPSHPGRHRRGIPPGLLARLGATATPPVVGRVPGRVGAAGALHVQPRPGHPDHPGGGVMRTVEQVVAEIDAAIAGTGPLSPRLGTRPRTRPSNCWRAWAWPSPPPTPGARRRLAVRRSTPSSWR